MTNQSHQPPITTCQAEECDTCGARGLVQCRFPARDLALFYTVSLPVFIIGLTGLAMAGGWPLAVYIAIIILFFGFFEIRILCSHCPHYAEKGRFLRCWANHGMPKIWKFRPGPMAAWEKAGFVGGLAVVFGYPAVFLALGKNWALLVAYLPAAALFFGVLLRFYCGRCMNFACPFNRVPAGARKIFLDQNPSIRWAWEEGGGRDERGGDDEPDRG